MLMQALDFPGGKVRITSELNFISETNGNRVECYRVLGDDGRLLNSSVQVTYSFIFQIKDQILV